MNIITVNTNSPDSKKRTRIAVFSIALVVPFLASLFYAVLFPGTAFGNSFYSGVKIFLVAWPLASVFLFLKEKGTHLPGDRNHRASIMPGAAFGIAIVGLLFFLIKMTPLGAVVDDNSANIVVFVEKLGVKQHFIWFALFISFAHAALEEIYWRWFAFGEGRKIMKVGWAHLIAGIGFASHHVVIVNQFFPLGWALFLGACVAIGGIVWSWMYHRYNSLLGPWISHMIIDLGLMWVGWEALQAA